MGISASTLSRERTADDDTTANPESAAVEQREAAAAADSHSAVPLDRVHCVRRKSCSASSEAATSSSASEMSDDDANSSSGGSDQRQGRRVGRRYDVLESESVDGGSATASASLGDAARAAPEVTAPHRSTTTTKNDKSLAEFREELRIKREQRRTALADLKNEVLQLRSDLAAERLVSQQLRAGTQGVNGIEADASLAQRDVNDVNDIARDRAACDDVDGNNRVDDADANEMAPPTRSVETVLRMQLANVNHQLQLANGDVLSLTAELSITQKQVGTLKEVIAVSKEMVNIREAQLEQLKTKLKEIEDSLAEREMTLMSDTLRKEYDRQLANIRSLRTLYEERARVSAAEKENMLRQIETKRTELQTEIEKSQELETRVTTLESELQDSANNLTNIKDDLIDCKAEKKGLEEETAAINQLFSQLLSGFNGGNDLNIDKLTAMLEENRDLLSDITSSETCRTRAAAMPKLLLELVSQIDGKSDETTDEVESPIEPADETKTAETQTVKTLEILNNLPKVWKVLIELLNHQKAESVPFNENGESEDCYKLVQSPTGPQHVLSVSKTYIRLKDLILEKKFLQKETHKLKNLNTHLETRLDQKERRLATVTVELNKTWTLVGRMQRQHRQLHTNEQVLRYQLSQKRRMLNELKEELEYCRRKWTLAREKNDESQTQWNTLRREFTARKLEDAGSQLSAESGYSDDPASDDEPLISEAMPLVDNTLAAGASIASSCSVMVEQLTSGVQEPLIIGMPVIVHQQHGGGDDGAGSSGSQSNKDGPGKQPLILSPELRNKKPKVAKQKKTTGGAESLEAMFYRISGQEKPDSESETESESEYEDDDDNDDVVVIVPETKVSIESNVIPDNVAPFEEEPAVPESEHIPTLSEIAEAEDDERHQRRAIRFERLEEQCQQLINQVQRTSSRGDELNRQLDDVHNRYRTPTREASVAEQSDAGPSTSATDSAATTSASNMSHDAGTEDACMTPKEQEYTSRRAARLLRLEAECHAFLNRVTVTNSRATELNDKATTLHEHHSARLAASRSESGVDSVDAVPEEVVASATVQEEMNDHIRRTTDGEGIQTDDVTTGAALASTRAADMGDDTNDSDLPSSTGDVVVDDQQINEGD